MGVDLGGSGSAYLSGMNRLYVCLSNAWLYREGVTVFSHFM